MPRHGYTLLELLITLLIGTVLLTLGTPAFTGVLLDSRRTADVNAFVTAVQMARSESAKRAIAVRVCSTEDGASCAGLGTQFDSGWLVVAADAEDSPLASYRPAIRGAIRSNRSAFVFRPGFRRGTNGTVVFCDQRGSEHARAVIISYTGRPRVSDTRAGGAALDCPA